MASVLIEKQANCFRNTECLCRHYSDCKQHTSEPHSVRFWKIEEAVGAGLYIVLDGIYTNQQDCKKAFPVDGYCKAVEYAQGNGNQGPTRVDKCS